MGQAAALGSSSPMRLPSNTDGLVGFIATTLAHTGRCVAASMLTYNCSDMTDSEGNFTGAIRRPLDCLAATAQAGVALSLISADRFCAVNIMRLITAQLGDGQNTPDSAELLAHLWLFEPLVRTGLQSPDSSCNYSSDAFWLCFLFEVGRSFSKLSSEQQTEEDSDIVLVPEGCVAAKIWKSVAPSTSKMPGRNQLMAKLTETLVPFTRLASLLSTVILNRQFSLPSFMASKPDLRDLCGACLGQQLTNCPVERMFADQATFQVAPFEVDSSIVNSICAKLKSLTANLKTVVQTPTVRRFIELPDNYADLLARAAAYVCPYSPTQSHLSTSAANTGTGQQQLLCLLCDTIVCGPNCEHCQRQIATSDSGMELSKPNPVLLHAVTCSGGRGVFLRLHDCCLYFVADLSGRLVKHPSMYTYVQLFPPFFYFYFHKHSFFRDRYGEPDPGLRRGGPLILSKQRFVDIERIWLAHGLADCAFKYYSSNRVPVADLIMAGI